ncbi:MAG: ABC transporter ATP-binding protein/permease, partial [Methylobacteriaceae bacterium]|nr:ABC transporter ATP-binding protein/permease [Methylobacteriaceae bacterium]
MSDTAAARSDASAPQPARRPLPAFLRLAGGFWSGDTRRRALVLTLAVAFFAAAVVAVQYGMNRWNRIFFDSLEKKDLPGVWEAILLLPLLVAAQAAAVSGMVVFRMLFQMRWREWLTQKLAGWWIADQRYYRLSIVAREQGAPEYRIAEDVRLSIEPLADFAIGLASAFATAATFVGVLWTVGGSFSVGGVVIPAYMAVAAVAYGAISSLGAYFAGRPLVGHVSHKNQMEAEFRAEMTRLRENAESIALIRGDKGELRGALANYELVVAAWKKIVRQNGVIAIVYNINGALFPIAPLLLAAPKYLSGEMTL